jgi:hypothetical protein
VKFVCEDLDPFMESIREYFDSMITEEMRAKEKEREEKVREVKRQEERHKWEVAERRRMEEQERKRKAEEQKRQESAEKNLRLREQERRRQMVEAEKEAKRNASIEYQQSLEEYHKQLTIFENERLHQWREAGQIQSQLRNDYAVQQKVDVQQERTQLWSRKTTVKHQYHKLNQILALHQEEKMLRNFSKELLKPIEEQIKDAWNFRGDNSSNEHLKSDKLCGGRRFARKRIETLISLDQVPKRPEDFIPDGVIQPVEPQTFSIPHLRNMASNQHYVLPPIVRHRSIQTFSSLEKEEEEEEEVVEGNHHGILPRPQPKSPKQPSWSISRSVSRFSYLGDDLEEEFGDEYIHTGSSDKTEMPEEADEMEKPGKTGLEKFGDNEIQRRDKIMSLQEIFQQFDRSAISSMAKGKQTFNKSSDLISLLQHSRNCEASDLRDRVYAFLGLAHEGYGITPDYTTDNNIETVLIETAKDIIRFDKSLEILKHVHRGRDRLGLNLPSWVPDWTSKETTTYLDECTGDETQKFDAAKGFAKDFEFGIGTGHDYVDCLKVCGKFVDTVIEDPELESSENDDYSLFETKKGDLVIAPKFAGGDDEIWVLNGLTKPAVMRPSGENRYGYLGNVLIYDKGTDTPSKLMFGEEKALDEVQARSIWIM